jgi:SAM-dependent methyltransferase
MQNNKYIALLKKEGNKYFIRNRDYYKSDKKNYQIYDLFRTTKISPNTILEIGTANGMMLNQYKIASNAKFCLGIDLSSKAIKNGRKKYKNLQFKILSSLNINLIKKNFDLIICGFFLYLLPRKEIFKQFDKIYQKIEKNGYLLIYDFNPLFKHTNTLNVNKKISCFKMSYDSFLEESGMFKLIYKFRTNNGKKNDLKKFKSEDLGFSLFKKIDFKNNYPSNL